MIIKVLGPGCRNCRTLQQRTEEALQQLGVQASVEKVTDPAQIVGYGVLRTPGLVVDERLLISGRVPTTTEITDLLNDAA